MVIFLPHQFPKAGMLCKIVKASNGQLTTRSFVHSSWSNLSSSFRMNGCDLSSTIFKANQRSSAELIYGFRLGQSRTFNWFSFSRWVALAVFWVIVLLSVSNLWKTSTSCSRKMYLFFSIYLSFTSDQLLNLWWWKSSSQHDAATTVHQCGDCILCIMKGLASDMAA